MSDLVVFTCSKSKNAVGGTATERRVADFLSPSAVVALQEARARAFQKSGTCIDTSSPLTPALKLYSPGICYSVDGFCEAVTEALAVGRSEVLILSGGYGLVHPAERIQYYEASIQRTKCVWRHVLPGLLLDYIKMQKIARAFIACSSEYWSAIGPEHWRGSLRELYSLVPKEGRGSMSKVLRAIGNGITSLLRSDLGPDENGGGGTPNRSWANGTSVCERPEARRQSQPIHWHKSALREVVMWEYAFGATFTGWRKWP